MRRVENISPSSIPKEYQILSLEGYWERVFEIKQANNDITVNELWKVMEDELRKFGTTRYSSFLSFKRNYYRYINQKLK